MKSIEILDAVRACALAAQIRDSKRVPIDPPFQYEIRWHTLRFIKVRKAEALILADDETIVVAFPGTRQLIDVAADFFSVVPARPGWLPVDEPRRERLPGVENPWRRYPIVVGWGFLRQYNRLRGRIVQELIRLRREGAFSRKLIVTGHSLGGALAQLCVADLLNRPTPRPQLGAVSLWTFGGPRPGRLGFARWWSRCVHPYVKATRVVHAVDGKLDVVTRVPLSRFGHRHPGEPLILYDGEGEDIRVHRGNVAWQAGRRRHRTGLVRGVSSALAAVLGWAEIHPITEYVAAVEKAVEKGLLDG